MHSRVASDSGQAAVETLLALPLIAVTLVIALQVAVAGQTWWALTELSRVAAREASVAAARSGPEAAERAARSAVRRLAPAGSGIDIHVDRRGTVRVSRPLPLLGPLAFLRPRAPMVAASAGGLS